VKDDRYQDQDWVVEEESQAESPPILIFPFREDPSKASQDDSLTRQYAEIWNIARNKPTSAFRVSVPSALLNDGIVRPTSGDGSVPSLNLQGWWQVDLKVESYVDEVLVLFHRSANNVQHPVSIRLLNSGNDELRAAEFATAVGVVYWKNLDLEGVRFVQVRPTEQGSSLPLEEVEVYGIQARAPQAKNPLNLIITGYLPNNVVRQVELSETLRRNLRNPYIEQIHVISENCSPEAPTSISHPKLTRTCVDHQPKYSELFRYANDNMARQLVVVTNGDIVFTDSLRHIGLELPYNKKRVGMILSRWAFNCPEPVELEVTEFAHRCWTNFRSYDTFVYRPKIPRTIIGNMTHVMNRMYSEHQTGRLLKHYLSLDNPCLDIVTLHNHCSGIREWKVGTKENDYLPDFTGRSLRFVTRNLLNVTIEEMKGS